MTAEISQQTSAIVRASRPSSLPEASDKFVVVEASAGTGKTFFLEHRAVDLVLAGADLGELLLVTFTDKAVAELRMRIRDVFDRLARATVDTASADEPHWAIDDDARARLRAAVSAFDRAPIFTIHGFCHRVLIEDAFAARRLFQQAQVADEVAFDAAFSALLRERFARVDPDRELLAAFLQSEGETSAPVDKLRDLLLGCVRAGALPRRTIDPKAAVDAAHSVYELFARERRGELEQLMYRDGRDNWLREWIAEIGHTVDHTDLAGYSPARCLGWLDELRPTLDKFAAKASRAPALAQLLADVGGTITLAEAIAAQLLPPVLARIAADKAEHGQFDYDDMLRLVRDAIAGPRGGELATRLRTRMPWVMIDEFQDTDATQWQIFRTVWMHADARGLTVVGDPKQAIYGFRGADVHTYLDATSELRRAGARSIALDVNRRSTPELVAAVNHILVGTVGMPLLDGEIAYDPPVRASGDVVCASSADRTEPDSSHRPQGDAGSRSERSESRTEYSNAAVTLFELPAQLLKDASKAVLADAIGDEIEALRRAPPVWQRRGVAMPFSLADVMILTRGHKESSQIAAALRARGLPCSLLESDKLFATREAHELASVLAAIAAPRDRGARLRALRTRFFDVAWADLARVVDAPDHDPLIARLFDWAALASRRAYETLFRRLVEDSRFGERALVVGGGERAVTNTWHLVELLLGEVARSRCDLHELVDQLRRWIADEQLDRFDDLDVQRAETDAEAIRILTIHKAKGLEAPYVFLFGGISARPPIRVSTLRDRTGRRLVVHPKDEPTLAEIRAQDTAEDQRLAYVALTRAQVRLYLPRYGDKACKRDSMYGSIQKCLAAIGRSGERSVEPGFAIIRCKPPATATGPAPADALADFVAPAAPSGVEPAVITGARGGLAMWSYTKLAHSERSPEPAVAAIGEHEHAVLAADELPPGAASGLLLHHVLEHADLATARAAADFSAWLVDPDVRDSLDDAGRLYGIDPRCFPHAARLAHATLTSPIALADGGELPAIVAADAVAREVGFAFPLPTDAASGLGAGLVSGYIDAVVAWGDELWIVDYKSDLLVGDVATAARARVQDRYATQARLYALAADRMRGQRRLAGMIFAFIRHGVAVSIRVDDGKLAEWSGWLGELANAPELAATIAKAGFPEVHA